MESISNSNRTFAGQTLFLNERVQDIIRPSNLLFSKTLIYKILPLVIVLTFSGCASTSQPGDKDLSAMNQQTKNLPSANKRVKKLTDSKNKEDDNFFEFILTKIDKAITFIINDKTPDGKGK